eukprot:TRINITY_DN886_c0_g3_i1.p1 TRINITY_DN886_c0_g3~~TRINITY_DN886_c0_g3_i1.p1  ORF type:complete len:734 (+),score=161.54 TRINITY_DN886_c0_g3_i1:2-2203(+)
MMPQQMMPQQMMPQQMMPQQMMPQQMMQQQMMPSGSRTPQGARTPPALDNMQMGGGAMLPGHSPSVPRSMTPPPSGMRTPPIGGTACNGAQWMGNQPLPPSHTQPRPPSASMNGSRTPPTGGAAVRPRTPTRTPPSGAGLGTMPRGRPGGVTPPAMGQVPLQQRPQQMLPNQSVTYLQDANQMMSQMGSQAHLPGMMPEASAFAGDVHSQMVLDAQSMYTGVAPGQMQQMDGGLPAQNFVLNSSDGAASQAQYSNGSDDGIIVEGRWLQTGQADLQQMQHMQPLYEAEPAPFYVEPAPPPVAPRPLPWLPSRRPAEGAKMLDKEEFLKRLNEVCDAFEPNDSGMEGLGSGEYKMQQAFAAAEDSLIELVEQAVMSGPIRHLAICVLARRVTMLAESIRQNPDTPGGKRLMVALLTGVKKMCAANTGEVRQETGERDDRFSGRVVLLLGSASCSADALLKTCGERYRQLDPHCLVLALSMGAEPAGTAQLGKALSIAVNTWAEAVERHGAPGTAGGAGRPELLVHLFGSAGFSAYAHLLRIWDEQAHFPDQKRIPSGRVPHMSTVLRGVVLDSAPGDSGTKRLGALPLVQGDAALLSAMNSFGADGSEQSEADKLQASQNAMRELTKRDGALWEYYDGISQQEQQVTMNVHQREPPVPLMFAFSESDKIAPAAQIQRYIDECEMRQSQSNNAQNVPAPRRHCFERSAHVQHRSGPIADEYWRACSDFWRIALFC